MSIFVDSPKRRMPGFERELKPLKAIIHGPPLSGKTVIAKRISARYGAHYVSVKSMIEETLNELWKHIAYAKSRARLVNEISKSKEIIDSDEEDDDMDEEWGGNQADIEQWEEKIRDINSIMNKSDNEMLPDDYVVRLMSEFLAKGRCQSHGYVLDAFPKTYQQAREIFGQIAESERRLLDEGVMEIFGEDDRNIVKIGTVIGNASVNILPDFVISLQATDEFLFERAMNLPENQIKGKYDEQHMIRKLNEFRINNDPENTVLNFFNDIGIHPIIMGVCDETSDIESIVNYLYKIFGPPIPGFGLSLEEEQELRKLELEQDKLEEQAYLLQKQINEEKMKKEYEEKMEKWAETLEKLKIEEDKIVTAESEPIRFYLMKYILPTLAKGLTEVVKIKPTDPIDYLAEFLFKENPEGKMFDPSFTKSGEELLKHCEKELKFAFKN